MKQGDLELAVVLPTFNERANVVPVLEKLALTLADISYEVIFVDDDSPDGTADVARRIARENPRIRVIQRVGRRGLSSACIEGMMATSAPLIAVMDADLQHDDTVLPQMVAKLKQEQLDIVVATRNIGGGSMGNFAESRVRLSNLGRTLSNLVSHTPLSDPMSGFFVLDRRYLLEVVYDLSGIGFKLLLDLVASAKRPVRVGEIPYRFGVRVHGESKLDILVGFEYLQLLLDKFVGGLLPTRYLIFALVGSLGAIIHMILLGALIASGLQFLYAQAVTTAVVMTLNFFLNNVFTYRDRRLQGRRLLSGLLTFYAACALGAFINLWIASYLLGHGSPWYVAGFAGLVISSVWNYGITGIFTWRKGRTLQPRTA